MTKAEKIQRAERAEILLNDPLVVEAFDAIESACFNSIQGVEEYSEEKLKDIYYVLKAARVFKGVFKNHVREGQIAQNSLNGQNIQQLIR